MASDQEPDSSKGVVTLDPASWKGELRRLGGSRSDDFNLVLINQAARSTWLGNTPDAAGREQLTKASMAVLVGIDPKDEIEGMIAAQLYAAHNAAMECMRRAMIPEQSFDGRKENLAQANKLSRSFAALSEALDRHRGKGQQKVTVEHVHVHAGGQAVVGALAQQGGGGTPRSEEQPHALEHAPGTEMRSPNADCVPVPVTRDGQRPMPDARRR